MGPHPCLTTVASLLGWCNHRLLSMLSAAKVRRKRQNPKARNDLPGHEARLCLKKRKSATSSGGSTGDGGHFVSGNMLAGPTRRFRQRRKKTAGPPKEGPATGISSLVVRCPPRSSGSAGHRGGPGGNRTLVQTRKQPAFYTLIFAWIFVNRQDRSYPSDSLSSLSFTGGTRRPSAIPELSAPPVQVCLGTFGSWVMSRSVTLCRNEANLLYFD